MGERDYRKDNEAPTLGDIFERYEAQKVPQMFSYKTAEHALNYMRKVMGKETPITFVDQIFIDDFIKAERARGYADQTIKNRLTFLGAAINHAVRQRLLDNSVKPIYQVLDLHCPPRTTLVSPESVQKLLEIARQKRVKGRGPSRLEMYLMMIWQTGARDNCVRMALWSQIDLEKKTIDFRVPGRRETNKKRPVVPISRTLLDFLKGARPFAKNNHYLGGTGKISSTLTRATIDAGCPEVTAHVFRHTWATEAIESGVSLEHVAGVLGDSFNTVWKTYNHLRPEPLRPAVNFRERM
ncbi:MAG: tyrosine-type recombinase/integrase [Rhodobacteraceae bacterium]|nr:tyrosine-type recombinase/integrase [Paracoccaceae bacterium]